VYDRRGLNEKKRRNDNIQESKDKSGPPMKINSQNVMKPKRVLITSESSGEEEIGKEK
jgi:hypothetical protein